MSETDPSQPPADSGEDSQRALRAVQEAMDRRDNGGGTGQQPGIKPGPNVADEAADDPPQAR